METLIIMLVASLVLTFWFSWMQLVCKIRNEGFVPVTYYVTPYVSHYKNSQGVLDQRNAVGEF